MAEEHIKINPVPTKVKYSGNGVVREFPTGFAFFEDDNIVVYHNGVIINTGYSVTGVGETDGGVVTFDVAPAEGDKIVIIRKVAIERVTDFQEGGAFRAKNINDELDRQTAFCQQIQEEIDRCVKVEVTDDQTPEELLTEVYGKLDSATEVAQNAVDAATAATEAVASAEKTLAEVTTYVDESKAEIGALITKTTEEIDQTISDATEEIKEAAVAEADKAVRETIETSVIEASTSAEHARIWAEGEQAEVQELGGELSSKGWALQASNSATSASQSATQAKTSETNAKSYADSIEPDRFLSKETITNCITEIPQDIKLELNNGTLTLKAGSKVYVPNGKNADGSLKFDVVVIENDLVYANWGQASDKCFVMYQNGILYRTPTLENNYSGGNQPTPSNSASWWYDTANNVIKQYDGSSWSVKANTSLPIAIATFSLGAPTSIDQIFNGFGYIGSKAFTLPGGKGLAPNGRNADGSLRNIEYKIEKLNLHNLNKAKNWVTFASDGKKRWECLPEHYTQSNVMPNIVEENQIWYNIIENQLYYKAWDKTEFEKIYAYEIFNFKSSPETFTPKLPFHAVDYSEFSEVAKTVESLPKHKVVSSLPSTREEDTFYYIPE